jgi:DNA mismatch endonuclease (patch repair protein)
VRRRGPAPASGLGLGEARPGARRPQRGTPSTSRNRPDRPALATAGTTADARRKLLPLSCMDESQEAHIDKPIASSDAALRRMRHQRRRDTAPEMALRRLLHAWGLRYRVDAPLPGMRRRADLLFSSSRIVVFVDGCFWHSCPEHGSQPLSNGAWWARKLEANVSRDRDTDRRLRSLGWTVIRIWEHEHPEAAAGRVAEAVRSAR